jgi:sterol desaturase/sphingolipid hydroxylase (fatty acid hydroxylase superfamily)
VGMPDILDQLYAAMFGIFAAPSNRWFVFYLATSVLAAWLVFRSHAAKDPELKAGGFLRFAFPAEIWSHPGTRVDVFYFFLNKAVMAAAVAGSFVFAYAADALVDMLFALVSAPQTLLPGAPAWLAVGLTTAIGILAFDFALWLQHYVFHRVPVLWEFHKVHHSAEVMTPFTAGRMHPVDEFAGYAFSGVAIGLTYGVLERCFGSTLEIQLFQVNIVLIAFFTLGFHLRHSHVWMPYTGVWGRIFVSPAHHQLHHSIEREHWDRNMGFIFAFWDDLFGTLVTPKAEQKVRFGVNGVEERDYDTVLKLYWVPFRKAFDLLRGRRTSMEPLAASRAGDGRSDLGDGQVGTGAPFGP